jgi:hypothetical protein
MLGLLLLALTAVPENGLPIDGTFLDPQVMEIERTHDPAFRPTGPLATKKSAHEVGDRVNFWASDETGQYPEFYLLPATCRYVGEDVYVFVEDAMWDVHYDQEAVDQLAEALQDSTPSGSGGIIETEASTIGEIPDEIDGDPRVYFLVLDIRDGFDSTSTEPQVYIAGYFSPYNMFTEEEAWNFYGGHSNECEMLYLDCYPSDSYDAVYTASHELVHLIQWGIEPFAGEELWVIENEAQTGTYVCGYPAFQVSTFLEAGGVTPINWTSFPDDLRFVAGYGAGYLFFAYLYENYGGADFIYQCLHNSRSGVAGVEDAIQAATGTAPSLPDILEDWMLANFIDDTSVGDGRWGYQAFSIADYDSVSPGNRPGVDYTAVIGDLPFCDVGRELDGYSGLYYRLPEGGSGSFRAATSGLGQLTPYLYDEAAGTVQRLSAGEAGDVAVDLTESGTVMLLDRAFAPLVADVSAGSVVTGGGLAVYPVPSFGSLYLQFQSSGAPVDFAVFDASGAHVETVRYGQPGQGETTLEYPGAAGLSSGVYFYRFSQGGSVRTGKFAVVR